MHLESVRMISPALAVTFNSLFEMRCNVHTIRRRRWRRFQFSI